MRCDIELKTNRRGKKNYLGLVCAIVFLVAAVAIAVNQFALGRAAAGSSEEINGVIFQGFEWFLSDNGLKEENGENVETLWEFYSANADELAAAGYTAIWLPPAYKAANNDIRNEGYEPYDLYDLGEFNQQGRVSTKYGTKTQYLDAIDALHTSGIDVYADILLGHKAGGDEEETVDASKMVYNNRASVVSDTTITAKTKFTFPGRNGAYSTFTWDKTCFDGCEQNDNIYLFNGKSWDKCISTENGAADFLMFNDLDLNNQNVVNELISWGDWYVDMADLDGFRLDAVKHIDYKFMTNWLNTVRKDTGRELFSFGEYFSGDTEELNEYIGATDSTMSLCDFKLFYSFLEASKTGASYNLIELFDESLSEATPTKAVTFVNNHDQQYGRGTIDNEAALKDQYVREGFKLQSYTSILTRQDGYPCVFYGDYYGTKNDRALKEELDELLAIRRKYAYGKQRDYMFNKDCIGWTREGSSSKDGSGIAAMISDNASKSVFSNSMYVGTSHAGEMWYDYTGNYSGVVCIDEDGFATFYCPGGSYSVWVPLEVCNDTNAVKIYYYSKDWNTVNVHYQIGSGSWTSVPGVSMEATSVSKYYTYTIDLGDDSYVNCCFNNGSGTWNNNGGKNFKLKSGIYTVSGTSVKSGLPDGVVLNLEDFDIPDSPLPTATVEPTEPVKNTPTPTDKIIEPTVEPTVEPTIEPTVIPQPEKDTNAVIYYYTSSWNTCYFHYRLDDNAWTSVPGVAMEKVCDNYYKITIDMDGYSKIRCCFNNGSGAWDSKNSSDYYITQPGMYCVKSQQVETLTEPIE